MTARWSAVFGLALLVLGCGNAGTLATTWPAEDGDLVFVLRSVASGESDLVATVSGRPTLNIERDEQEGVFLVVLPEELLRSLHYAVDISPEALGRAALTDPGAGECSTRVRLREQRVDVDFPSEAQVFQLEPDDSRFEPSPVSAEALLGFQRLQLPLGEPPCAVTQPFQPFTPAPPTIAADDRAEDFNAVYRHDDVVFALTPTSLYALKEGQPFTRLNFNTFTRRHGAIDVDGMVTASGEVKMMVAFASSAASDAGALAWVSFDGTTPQLEASTIVNESLVDIAVGPQGGFTAVGDESRLFYGTVSGTIAQGATAGRLAQLTRVAISDAGEIAVSSDFEIARGNPQNLGLMAVTVLRENGLPIDTTVVGMEFVEDALVLATSNDGLFVIPPGLPAVDQLIVGISNPASNCGNVIPCLGGDRFESNRSMALVKGPVTRMYVTNHDCPIMAVYDVQTGCASDILLGFDKADAYAYAYASPKWLTVVAGLDIVQLPVDEL